MSVPPQYVDSVRLSDSLNCLRLYYYRHKRHLTVPEKALSLIYGSAIHAALASKYRGGNLVEQCMAFDSEWEAAGEREDSKRSAQKGLAVITAYNEVYGNDPAWKVLGTEMPFVWPISSTLIWVGIIDLLVQLPNNHLVLVDHKTTSMLNEGYWHGRNPNHQFTGYIGAARNVLGAELNTLMVNAVLVSKNKTVNESWFERRPTARTLEELDRWVWEIQTWWDIVKSCEAHDNWPRNPAYCHHWNRLCDYHIICTMTRGDYRSWEPNPEVFIHSPWDPLAELREKGAQV